VQVLQKRYGTDPLAGSAEDFVVAVAGAHFCFLLGQVAGGSLLLWQVAGGSRW